MRAFKPLWHLTKHLSRWWGTKCSHCSACRSGRCLTASHRVLTVCYKIERMSAVKTGCFRLVFVCQTSQLRDERCKMSAVTKGQRGEYQTPKLLWLTVCTQCHKYVVWWTTLTWTRTWVFVNHCNLYNSFNHLWNERTRPLGLIALPSKMETKPGEFVGQIRTWPPADLRIHIEDHNPLLIIKEEK